MSQVKVSGEIPPLPPCPPRLPRKQSLVDLQRNPDNQGEVRLLYHRVVAPTSGVLGWAGGDFLSFDLVFTDLDMMAANDVLDLVKASKIMNCFFVVLVYSHLLVVLICIPRKDSTPLR